MRKHLRKSFSVFLAVLLLLSTTAFALPFVGAISAEEMANATEVTLNTPVSLTIEANSNKCLKFTPATDGKYVLTSSDSFTGCSVWVYNGNNPDGGSQYGSVDGKNSFSTFDLTGGDTYYFEIWDYSDTTCTFTVLITTPDAFGASVATPIALNETKEVTIGDDGYTYFSFTPDTDGAYAFSGINEYNTYLVLLDDALNELNNYYGTYVSLNKTLSAGKTYYYRLRSSTEETFNITLQTWASQVAASATPLTLDTAHEVTLENNSKTVWLSFTPAADGDYVFTAENPSWFYFYAYDAAMDQIGFWSLGDAPRVSFLDGLTAGEPYYFSLNTYNSMSPFNVTMKTKADYIASLGATVLAEGVASQVQLNANYANSWLSFTPSASGTYTLSANNTTEYLSFNTYFSNPSSSSIFTSTPLICNMTLEAGTTYYFALSCYEAQNVEVTIQPTSAYLASLDAIVLTQGVAQSLSFDGSGEKVLLQFTPDDNTTYIFTGTNAAYVSSDIFTESFGYVYWSYISDYPMAKYANLEAGETYYIMLGSNSEQTFDFTVNTAEAYLAGLDATELTQDEAEEITVAGNYAKTWLKFTPDESANYTLTGTNENYLNLNAYYAPFSTMYGNGSTDPLAYTWPLSAGTTYYFSLNSYESQNFSVTMQTTDDYMSDRSTPLVLNTPATVPAYSETMFCFAAESTDTYVFTFEGPGVDATLYDAYMNGSYFYNSGSTFARIQAGEKRYLRVNSYASATTVTVSTMADLNAQPLTLNTPVTVTGNQWQYFTYTASEYGQYYFFGDNSTSFDVRAYYSSGNYSSYSDKKIRIENNIDRGETRIFAVKGSSAEATGTFTLFSREAYIATVAKPIELDTPTAVQTGEKNYYFFTPETTATYTFFDLKNESLSIYYGNSSDGGNGSVSRKLEAGTTYYFAAYGGYSDNKVTLSTTASFMATYATALVLDEPTTLTFADNNRNQYLTFTPEETGRYNLSGQNHGSGSFYVYDSDMKEVSSSYDTEFTLSAMLEAGKTYYYRINSYNPETFDVVLTRGCDHANSRIIPAVPATCTEDGKTVAVYCDDCNTWLFEAWTVPKGHKDANSDRVCDVCNQPAVEFVAPCNDEGTVTATLYTDGELIVTGEGAITKVPGAPEDDDDIDQGVYAGYVGKMAKVRELVLPEGITSVCSSAFTYCRLRKLVIPATCTSIGYEAFHLSAVEDLTIRNKTVALNDQIQIPAYGSYIVNGQPAESPIKTLASFKDYQRVSRSLEGLVTFAYEIESAVEYIQQDFGLNEAAAREVLNNAYGLQLGYIAAQLNLDLPDGTAFSDVPALLIANINDVLGTSFTSLYDMITAEEGQPIDFVNGSIQPTETLMNAARAKFGIDSFENMPEARTVPFRQNNNYDGVDYTACEGVVIRGVCGSTAQRAATAFGATFDVLSHNPGDPVQENVVEATEEAEGSYDEVIYCTTCDEELSRTPKIIPKLDHVHVAGEAVIENEVNATCTKAGSYDTVVYCTGCGQELSRETVPVPKAAHTPGDPFVTNRVDKTCTKDGGYDTVTLCTVCGTPLSSVHTTLEATGHTPGEPVIENKELEDCTEGGTCEEVTYCTVCGDEIDRVEQEIAPQAHTPGEATRENEVPATCGAEGSYDEVITCTVCGKEISRTPKTIDKLDHVWGAWTIVKEATVDEEGLERRVCTNDSSHVEERPIDKLPPTTDPTNPTNPTDPQPDQGGKNLCKYCGEEHTGFLGFFIRIIHSILALFGLHK